MCSCRAAPWFWLLYSQNLCCLGFLMMGFHQFQMMAWGKLKRGQTVEINFKTKQMIVLKMLTFRTALSSFWGLGSKNSLLYYTSEAARQHFLGFRKLNVGWLKCHFYYSFLLSSYKSNTFKLLIFFGNFSVFNWHFIFCLERIIWHDIRIWNKW